MKLLELLDTLEKLLPCGLPSDIEWNPDIVIEVQNGYKKSPGIVKLENGRDWDSLCIVIHPEVPLLIVKPPLDQD